MEEQEKQKDTQTETQERENKRLSGLETRLNSVPVERRRRLFWYVVGGLVAFILLKLIVSLAWPTKDIVDRPASDTMKSVSMDSLTKAADRLLDREVLPSKKREETESIKTEVNPIEDSTSGSNK